MTLAVNRMSSALGLGTHTNIKLNWQLDVRKLNKHHRSVYCGYTSVYRSIVVILLQMFLINLLTMNLSMRTDVQYCVLHDLPGNTILMYQFSMWSPNSWFLLLTYFINSHLYFVLTISVLLISHLVFVSFVSMLLSVLTFAHHLFCFLVKVEFCSKPMQLLQSTL